MVSLKGKNCVDENGWKSTSLGYSISASTDNPHSTKVIYSTETFTTGTKTWAQIKDKVTWKGYLTYLMTGKIQ
jgi:hypothetical protein